MVHSRGIMALVKLKAEKGGRSAIGFKKKGGTQNTLLKLSEITHCAVGKLGQGQQGLHHTNPHIFGDTTFVQPHLLIIGAYLQDILPFGRLLCQIFTIYIKRMALDDIPRVVPKFQQGQTIYLGIVVFDVNQTSWLQKSPVLFGVIF